jgi:hypothetical protein
MLAHITLSHSLIPDMCVAVYEGGGVSSLSLSLFRTDMDDNL